MKLKFVAVLILLLTLMTEDASSQESGLFGGRGIGTASTTDKARVSPAKARWTPKMLDFTKNESATPSRKPFSDLFTKKKSAFGSLMSKSNDKPSLFKKPKPISEWFPKKDPSKANLFQQMNSKTKNFFDRTTNWTSQKNQKMKDKSNATWDAIVKDYREIEARNKTTPAQPNLRSARAGSQPKVRF